MIALRFGMQKEDNIEHTKGNCHMFTCQYAEGR